MLGNARPTVLSLDHPLGVTTGAWLSSFNVWSGPGGQISSRPSEREGGSRGEVTGRRGFLALPWASSVTLAKSLSCFVPQFPICLMRVIMHWKMVRSLSSTERKCYPGNGHRYLFGGRAIKPSEAKGKLVPHPWTHVEQGTPFGHLHRKAQLPLFSAGERPGLGHGDFQAMRPRAGGILQLFHASLRRRLRSDRPL